MNEPMMKMNPTRSRTQLCLKMLLHIYDRRIAFSQDTPMYSRKRDGLLQKMGMPHDHTFKYAISELKDKALIRQYEDEQSGLLYVAITPKGIQMVEGPAKVMMSYFIDY